METIRQIGVGLIGLALLVVIVGQVVGVVANVNGGTGGDAESYTDALQPSGDSVSLSGSNISAVSVQQSLNDSAALDGSASITTDESYLGDATWTVSTWVQVDNTTGTRQAVALDGQTWLVFNGTSSEWACWRYADGEGTHRVAVSAASPASWTNLQCSHDGTTLELRRNDSAATASVVTDAANATGQTLVADNLDGRLDETRVFNSTLDSSEQSRLYQRPTAPAPGTNRTARVMYDAYGSYGSSLPIYIAGDSASLSGVTKGQGLQGEATAEGTDWSLSSGTVSLLAGGVLDGAPVVFVTWTAAGGGGAFADLNTIVAQYGAIFGLLVLIPLVLAGRSLFDTGF